MPSLQEIEELIDKMRDDIENLQAVRDDAQDRINALLESRHNLMETYMNTEV